MEHLLENNEKLKGKIERINEMDVLGFNIPEYFLVHDELTLDHLKREIFPNHKRMSMRTYSKVDEVKEFECPHFPNHIVSSNTPIPDGTAPGQSLMDLVDVLYKKYYLMLSPPINPADCLYAGNVIVPELWNDKVCWNYIQGPGTVRDVKTRGIELMTDRRERIDIHPDFEIIRRMILNFPKESVIIEWSIYDKPIGKAKQNIVFWEFREMQ